MINNNYYNSTYCIDKKIVNNSTELLFSDDFNFYNFYMKKVRVELITNDDGTMLFPFLFYFNNQTIIPTVQKIRSVDCGSFKQYYFEFYLKDINHKTTIKIINTISTFWGVINFDIFYFKCANNCEVCSSLKQCTYCPLNGKLFKTNLKIDDNVTSCVCNEFGYSVSNSYTNLVCVDKFSTSKFLFYLGSNNYTNIYINDLNSYEVNPLSWRKKGVYFSNDSIFYCNNNVILMQKINRFTNFEKNIFIPGQFFSLTISFDFNYFNMKKLSQIYLKLLINDLFYDYTKINYPTFDNIICEDGRSAYTKRLNFTFINKYKDYLLFNYNLNITILAHSDLDCVKDEPNCYFGISNFKTNISLILDKNNKLANECDQNNYKNNSIPSLSCSPSINSLLCLPGFFNITINKCISKQLIKLKDVMMNSA